MSNHVFSKFWKSEAKFWLNASKYWGCHCITSNMVVGPEKNSSYKISPTIIEMGWTHLECCKLATPVVVSICEPLGLRTKHINHLFYLAPGAPEVHINDPLNNLVSKKRETKLRRSHLTGDTPFPKSPQAFFPDFKSYVKVDLEKPPVNLPNCVNNSKVAGLARPRQYLVTELNSFSQDILPPAVWSWSSPVESQ